MFSYKQGDTFTAAEEEETNSNEKWRRTEFADPHAACSPMLMSSLERRRNIWLLQTNVIVYANMQNRILSINCSWSTCCEIWTTILYTDGDQVCFVKFMKSCWIWGVFLALGTYQRLQDGRDLMIFSEWSSSLSMPDGVLLVLSTFISLVLSFMASRHSVGSDFTHPLRIFEISLLPLLARHNR